MAHHQHRASGGRAVSCAVLTVSDSRTPETDGSGHCIRTLLEAAGHRVAAYTIVRDEAQEVRARIEAYLNDPSIEAVIVNGGTGLAPRDTTYEAIVDLLDKRLDGFGELFRMLSYEQVGAAAMLSRATAGVARGTLVAALPGSPAAVELGMTKLLVPQLAHMVGLLGG
jgi:molybdenum cofactor biosynthesis protein B